ncbi:MAG: hypothetical protein LBH11_01135 [Propionibacteriaceae bacterium]|nr:hypothetical protein [Propionibacteriaceae bacterium]
MAATVEQSQAGLPVVPVVIAEVGSSYREPTGRNTASPSPQFLWYSRGWAPPTAFQTVYSSLRLTG